jgi:DNA-directed RNA polymerase
MLRYCLNARTIVICVNQTLSKTTIFSEGEFKLILSFQVIAIERSRPTTYQKIAVNIGTGVNREQQGNKQACESIDHFVSLRVSKPDPNHGLIVHELPTSETSLEKSAISSPRPFTGAASYL